MDNTEDTLSTDQLFSVVMIDRARKVKVTIQLRDQDGDEIPVRETIEKLTEWIVDQAKSEDRNVCNQQILPLMGQAMVGGMIKLLGPHSAAVMISGEATRYGLLYMMTVGFYLVKWLQKKKIKIRTFEKPITDEEIEMYDRISKASDISVQASTLGMDPKNIFREMIKAGKLRHSDLEQFGYSLDTEPEADNGDDTGNN